jgi:type II secretory pathway predicted ATPase ExeA
VYEAFYRLREKPFSILPDPSFLYLSPKHSTALALLEYGLMNQAGFNVITGEIGTGKTTLIRYLLSQMGRDMTVGLISNTHRSFGELLQWILFAFNLEHRAKQKVEMFQDFLDFLLQEYSQNKRTVLIIDEAQNMAADTLEELRMLSNVNADKDQVLQVILVGQAGLRDTFRRPDMQQFAQRIVVDYHLEPLDRQETRAYIRHRIAVAGGHDLQLFDDAACDAVYEHSQGVPRLINLLCDTALVYGFGAQNTRIDARIVNEVAHDKQEGEIFPSPGKKNGGEHLLASSVTAVLHDSVVPFEQDYYAAETRRHGVFDNRPSVTHTNIGPADYSEESDSDRRDADFMNYLKTTHADIYSNLRSAARSFTKKKS